MLLSLERIKYHEWLEKFRKYFKSDSLIYDIGKSRQHDYADLFQGCQFKTIDRNPEVMPDILIDLEHSDISSLQKADGILFNGVIEQCGNPFKLLEASLALLRSSGLMLIGSMLTGFPVYENDYCRFTERGIRRLLDEYRILSSETIYRAGVKDPTYIYLIVQKTKRE